MTGTYPDYIQIIYTDHIAEIVVSRPDKRNALSAELMLALTQIARDHHDRSDVRVLILRGLPVFSAGADLRDPDLRRSGLTRLEQRRVMRLGLNMCSAWKALEQPTIAAIEGYAIGGGLALAVSCDWRIMARDAHLRLPEVPLGMNMSWQSNPALVALIGPARAKHLVILGESVDSETAFSWGLVDMLVDSGDCGNFARSLADRVSALPPIPVQMSKRAIDISAAPLAGATSFMDIDQYAYTAETDDRREAIKAYFEKREPHYRGN